MTFPRSSQADVLVVDARGRTALHYCAESGGASPGQGGGPSRAGEAAAVAAVEAARLLLARDQILMDVPDSEGSTPIQVRGTNAGENAQPNVTQTHVSRVKSEFFYETQSAGRTR